MNSVKYVYFFGGDETEGNRSQKELLGGKGANLAEMTKLGLPVPPGFTISTEACAGYYNVGDEGSWPDGLEQQIRDKLSQLEGTTGKKFGSGKDPMLVSVRSGAAVSMPGMMDTVLNIGLNDTVTETMKLVGRMLGEKISVEFDLGSDMDTIVGDVQQINQLIMNLAINARDAMQDGGTITISTREMPTIGALARRFTIPGIERCQILDITDTGSGMDDETKERIFEPFFTTKEPGITASIAFDVGDGLKRVVGQHQPLPGPGQLPARPPAPL